MAALISAVRCDEPPVEVLRAQRFPRWSARSAFYLSRLLGLQIDAGQAYVNLKPVVGVHLLDFDLLEGRRSALWYFEMRDRHDPSVRLGDELSLHVVELRNADRAIGWGGDEPMAFLPRMGFAPRRQGSKVAP